VANAYGGALERLRAESIIPKPFDPRLILHIRARRGRAAMESARGATPDHGL